MNIKPVLVTGQDPPIDDLNRLYDFYVDIWQDTWSELNVNATSFRDDFLRLHTKLGLYIDERPIAFHGYGCFNLKSKADQDHSYFRKLNVPLTEKLIELGLTNIATLEYMAVDPDFRKISNHPTGEILAGFSIQYFKNDSYDATVTVTRNNRSVNKLCKTYGGYALFENLPLHNVEVDIMVFEPDRVRGNPNREIQFIVEGLLDKCGRHPQIGVAA